MSRAPALLSTALGGRRGGASPTLSPSPTALRSPAGARGADWRYGVRAFARVAADARRDLGELVGGEGGTDADADADAVRALASECASLDDSSLRAGVAAAVAAAERLRASAVSRSARADATRLLFILSRASRLVAPSHSLDGGVGAPATAAPSARGDGPRLDRALTLPPPRRRSTGWSGSGDGDSPAGSRRSGGVATALAAALDAAALDGGTERGGAAPAAAPSPPALPATPDPPSPARTPLIRALRHRLGQASGPAEEVAGPAGAPNPTPRAVVCRICETSVPAPSLASHTAACTAAARDDAPGAPPGSPARGRRAPSVSDFHILKPISRGAYGRVYLARKKATGDLYALKAMRKADLVRRNATAAARAERDCLAAAACPFVVASYYAFTSAHCVYIVMEYAPGGDLASLLSAVGRLGEPAARAVAADAVLALEFCHAAGVVHRDVKPDNLLVDGKGRVKLADFGLSTAGVADRADAGPVRAAADPPPSRPACVGTPDYLAPELLLGTGHGAAADWWSLGATLFELLTGAPPFAGPTPEAVFGAVLARRIAWPGEGALSGDAVSLIDALLDPDPSTRLGARGAPEVKAHPFFAAVDWAAAAAAGAPPAFVPALAGADDTSYFSATRVAAASLALDAGGGVEAVAAAVVAAGEGGSEGRSSGGDAARAAADASASDADSVAFSDFSYTNLDTLGAANAALAGLRAEFGGGGGGGAA